MMVAPWSSSPRIRPKTSQQLRALLRAQWNCWSCCHCHHVFARHCAVSPSRSHLTVLSHCHCHCHCRHSHDVHEAILHHFEPFVLQEYHVPGGISTCTVADQNSRFLCTRQALQVFLCPKSDSFFDPRQRVQMRVSMVITAFVHRGFVVVIWYGRESGEWSMPTGRLVSKSWRRIDAESLCRSTQCISLAQMLLIFARVDYYALSRSIGVNFVKTSA